MIKTAIIYTSHHGTTETVAKLIQQQLQPLPVDLIDLKINKHPCTGNYETIILGSSIHAGKNQSVMQNFCKRYMPELLQKRIGLFLCCMNKAESEQNIQNAYPEILRNRAFSIQLMGGEYRMEKMNFIEKFLLKKIVKVTSSQSSINYAAVSGLVKEINDEKIQNQ
jgi:menaquinone-dependent protoporphyrinogen oxidase